MREPGAAFVSRSIRIGEKVVPLLNSAICAGAALLDGKDVSGVFAMPCASHSQLKASRKATRGCFNFIILMSSKEILDGKNAQNEQYTQSEG